MSIPSFSGLGFDGVADDFGLDFGFSQPTFDGLGLSGSGMDFGLDSPNFGRDSGSSEAVGAPDPGFNEVGETPPSPLRVVPLPPEERSPPRVNQPALAPLPVVPLPAEERMPAPVVDTAVADRAAQDAQVEGDAANERRRRAAVIRDRQNPTGPRGLLTRPLVQRPRLLGQ
ncbi:MAG: hypothetical protein RID42_00275 [Alphaproteobacteria bacterium]